MSEAFAICPVPSQGNAIARRIKVRSKRNLVQSREQSFETAETKTKERWGDINVRYKNNIGPQVRRRRYALGWSQSDLATRLQLAGFDISEKLETTRFWPDGIED